MIKKFTFMLVLTLMCGQASVSAQDRYNDSLALVSLYNATNGATWTTPWNLSMLITTWYGVQIENDRVTGIDLDGIPNFQEVGSWNTGNHLVGTIPNDLNTINHNLDKLTLFIVGTQYFKWLNSDKFGQYR
jgi:hypothetical protein